MTGERVGRRTGTGVRATVVIVTIIAALAALVAPAGAEHRIVTEVEAGVGFFYGTFNESPNIAMLVGGTVEEFCEANPDDPFSAEPGTATRRIIERKDGTVRIKLKTWNQPIHLYEIDFPGAPPWIEQECASYFAGASALEPFASGHGFVRSRVTIHPDGLIDVFNVSRGKVMGNDGKWYRVRGSADFVVENGVPVGNPEDFVSFSLRKVRPW